MPKLIGKSTPVVDLEGFAIEEYVGNVATQTDSISVAVVRVSQPKAEPWATVHYDERICVKKGKIEVRTEGSEPLFASAGETLLIEKGERVKVIISERDTEYISVCLPAFRPDRSIREEEEETEQSAAAAAAAAAAATESTELQSGQTNAKIDRKDYEDIQVLYHMCQKSVWEEAVAAEKAYFPPTFESDGFFTHATAVPARLITTANHFYTETEGDWICLELNRAALFKLGIDTVFEEAKPVGATDTNNSWDWVCPHIYGGLPTHIEGIVTMTYDMKRESDGTFLSIVGLTDQ